MMKVLIILNLWFALCHCLNDETRMVADVIKAYERPTTVVAKLCWKFSEKRNLMVQLMKTNKAVRVAFISDLKEIQKYDPKDAITVIDLNCQDSDRFLQQADDNSMYGKPYRWLIIAKSNELTAIPAELRNLRVLVDSEVIVAEKRGNYTFMLNLVYRIDRTSDFRTEKYGTWTTTEGFKLSETVTQTTMVIRRKDLQGKSIASSYVITDNSTRTKIHELQDLKSDNIAKVTHHNLLPLYYFMNATKALLFTDTWGYYINNSWNGMTGDIVHGEAELSGTLSFMSLQRVHVVQYMTQPIRIKPKFLFREPALSLQNNLFILPFRGAVWLCIGGMVVILIIFIYMNAKWEAAKDGESAVANIAECHKLCLSIPQHAYICYYDIYTALGNRNDPFKFIIKDSALLKPSVSDIAMFVLSAITQQGSTNELKGSLGRVVTFLMFLLFLFLYTSYSANIVALLQSSSNQIRTLTDLLNSKLELGVEDEKYNRHYFPAATEKVRKAIYENKIAKVGYKPNFMSVQEGVRRIRNKEAPFAFHMNLGIGYKIVQELFLEHEKCDLHEISYYPDSIPWFFSKKLSPYKEIYKIGLARTMEHGLAARVTHIFYTGKPSCTTRGGSFTSVNMMDFYPVLLWMLYGVSLSVFLLVLEILMHRIQHGCFRIRT